jgi:hypothetical protein
MTDEQANLALGQITRSITVIEHLRTILRVFMDSKKGFNSTGREDYLSFSVLERIYFNLIAASPLLKELAFENKAAIPLSHILRGIAYEIIFAYWVLDKNYQDRMAMVNNDFIRKNYKALEEELKATEVDKQNFLATIYNMAPENIEVDAQGLFRIKKLKQRFVFSEACDEVLSAGFNVKSLVLAYTALSQQAHFSDFSRGLINEKYHHQIGIFDTIAVS